MGDGKRRAMPWNKFCPNDRDHLNLAGECGAEGLRGNGAIGDVPQLHQFALQREQPLAKGAGKQERTVLGVAALIHAKDDLDVAVFAVDVHNFTVKVHRFRHPLKRVYAFTASYWYVVRTL